MSVYNAFYIGDDRFLGVMNGLLLCIMLKFIYYNDMSPAMCTYIITADITVHSRTFRGPRTTVWETLVCIIIAYRQDIENTKNADLIDLFIIRKYGVQPLVHQPQSTLKKPPFKIIFIYVGAWYTTKTVPIQHKIYINYRIWMWWRAQIFPVEDKLYFIDSNT